MSVDNNIPKGWIETTLGEVINLIGGGTPKTTINKYWNGNIPWLSVVDFNNDNRWVYDAEKSITELGLQKSSTKLLKIDDIIISARGTVGAMAQLKKEMAFNQSCYGIREVENVSNIDFLFYLTKYSLKQINRNTYGAVFDTITTKTFNVINVNLPPLQEQKAIANILTAFDDKIALLQAQNKTLETTAQTIFKEWFGKYQIGDELPEDWRVGKLGDLIDKTIDNRGKTPPLSKDGNHLMLETYQMSSKNPFPSFYQNSKQKYINSDIYNSWFRSGHPKYLDILFATVGNGIPNWCFMPKNVNNYCIAQNLVAFRAKENIKGVFLKYFFDTRIFKSLCKGIIITTAQPSIKLSHLRLLDIIIPKQELIDRFNLTVKPKVDSIFNNTQQIQTLKKTRDTLLPKLMSGQLRVEAFKN